MKNYFKLQIILCISFFILIPLNLKAQKEFTPKQDLKNHLENSIKFEKYIFSKLRFIANQDDEILRKYPSQIYNRSQLIENFSEQPGILSEVMPLTVNKTPLTDDVLDSVVYHTEDGEKYKESFTYDGKAKRLTSELMTWLIREELLNI